MRLQKNARDKKNIIACYFYSLYYLSLSGVLFSNGDKDCPNFRKSEIDKNWDYTCSFFVKGFLRPLAIFKNS